MRGYRTLEGAPHLARTGRPKRCYMTLMLRQLVSTGSAADTRSSAIGPTYHGTAVAGFWSGCTKNHAMRRSAIQLTAAAANVQSSCGLAKSRIGRNSGLPEGLRDVPGHCG